jgi:phosphotransferase family enzyme
MVTSEPAEELLVGDGVTPGIVRVGETVRRPRRPFNATVQAFLSHLHANGFTAAPRPLGFDDQDREVLSYVAGDVPREPLPDWATGVDVLADLARLIRAEHDAAQGWVPPPDAVWGSIPGDVPENLPPLVAVPELVAHQDYCPGNVVFRAGRPVGLIDFDLARPTTRLADAVNAMYWWVPLLHPTDRPPALVDADVAGRIRVFADAYGMNRELRQQLVPFAVRRAHYAHLSARAAAEADPIFRHFWEQGVKDRMPRAEQWWADNQAAIARELD